MIDELYDEAMGPEPSWLDKLCDFFNLLKNARSWRERCENLDAELLIRKNAQRRAMDQVTLYRKELHRLRDILAPYGLKILAGQADDTEGAIRLPELEYEMARSYMNANARVTGDIEDVFLTSGFDNYMWRSRRVMRANPVQRPFTPTKD